MKISQVDVLDEPGTVLTIANIYQETFGREPWQEGYTCPICHFTVGLDLATDKCPSCSSQGLSINMIECWPKSKVLADFYEENRKPGAICLVAIPRYEPVGFVWGYEVKITPETVAKIDAPGLEILLPVNHVFYLDECAVLPQFQHRGIGISLVKDVLKRQYPSIMILRTLAESSMFHLVTKLGGKKVISLSKGRIIMSLEQPRNIPNYLRI